MKKYEDTIIKSKYKNFIKIDMNNFLKNIDKECDTWQRVEEIILEKF